MASNLLFDIAWTHVTSRVRQTLVGMAGVAMGVGQILMEDIKFDEQGKVRDFAYHNSQF